MRAEADRLLDFLWGEYEWAVQRGVTWGEDQFLSFIAEQPLRDEALDDLGSHACYSALTLEQRAQLARLERYLDLHRDELEALLHR
jgi:hypothetical protein